MSDSTKKSAPTSLVTPVLRWTFCDLFVPRLPKKAVAGTKARYSVTGLVPPIEQMSDDDKIRWKAIQDAVMKCGRESELGPEKFLLYLKDRKIKIPIRADVESSGFPTEFKFFIRAWTYVQPGIVSIYKGADGKPTEIKDPNLIYSGCWGRLSIRPFYSNYEQQNPAIGFQLQNAQKIRDDERLDGRKVAQDEFDATDDMPAGMDLGGGAGGSVGGDTSDLATLLGGS